MDRNSLTEDEAMQKINAQMPINVKVKKSDITVENGNTIKDLNNLVIRKVIPQVY